MPGRRTGRPVGSKPADRTIVWISVAGSPATVGPDLMGSDWAAPRCAHAQTRRASKQRNKTAPHDVSPSGLRQEARDERACGIRSASIWISSKKSGRAWGAELVRARGLSVTSCRCATSTIGRARAPKSCGRNLIARHVRLARQLLRATHGCRKMVSIAAIICVAKPCFRGRILAWSVRTALLSQLAAHPCWKLG